MQDTTKALPSAGNGRQAVNRCTTHLRDLMPKHTVNFTPEQSEWLDSIADPFAGKSGVIRDLVNQAMRQHMQSPFQGLDTASTLGGPPAGGTPSTSNLSNASTSNLNLNPRIYKAITGAITPITEAVTAEAAPPVEQDSEAPAKASRKRKPRAEGTPEFEAFWRQYLAISKRASNQSKPKAIDQWLIAVKTHSPAQLLAALAAAKQAQARIERDGGFASPFPDAFRWLRDGYHVAYVAGALQGQPEASQRAPWDSPDRKPGDPF